MEINTEVSINYKTTVLYQMCNNAFPNIPPLALHLGIQNMSDPCSHWWSLKSYHHSYLYTMIGFHLFKPCSCLHLLAFLDPGWGFSFHTRAPWLPVSIYPSYAESPSKALQHISLFPFLIILILHWPLEHLKIRFKWVVVQMLQALHALLITEFDYSLIILRGAGCLHAVESKRR